MKKILIVLAIIFVLFVVGILIIGRTFYPDNVAETTPDGGKKELFTRTYKTDFETATKTVKEIIPNLATYGSNWKIVDEEINETSALVKVEVPVIVFTDDLEVKISKAENETQINVVSKSRVGKSDFGENARHVRKILNSLDEKLAKK